MIKKRTMAPKRGNHYSNVVVIGREGRLLSTIADRRAEWYLRKGLAVEVMPPAGYPRAIRLTFEHQEATEFRPWEANPNLNRCVVCGTSEALTLHHVVPWVIRRHFPLAEKAHDRSWCVLLCVEHHIQAEELLDEVYRNELPQGSKDDRKTNITLQKIKASGNVDRVPPEKLVWLLARSDYRTFEDIPPYNGRERRIINQETSRRHNERIRRWAHEFIARNGGFDGTKLLFRREFLKLRPRFIPDGFLGCFGRTMLVESDGSPKVLFHGTNAEFERFSMDYFGKTDRGYYGRGFYFTVSEETAREYGNRVMRVHIKAENPLVLPSAGTMGHPSVYDARDILAELTGKLHLKTDRTVPEGYKLEKREYTESDGHYGGVGTFYHVAPKPELYGTGKEVYGEERKDPIEAVISFNDERNGVSVDSSWLNGVMQDFDRDHLMEMARAKGHDAIFIVDAEFNPGELEEVVVDDPDQILVLKSGSTETCKPAPPTTKAKQQSELLQAT